MRVRQSDQVPGARQEFTIDPNTNISITDLNLKAAELCRVQACISDLFGHFVAYFLPVFFVDFKTLLRPFYLIFVQIQSRQKTIYSKMN